MLEILKTPRMKGEVVFYSSLIAYYLKMEKRWHVYLFDLDHSNPNYSDGDSQALHCPSEVVRYGSAG